MNATAAGSRESHINLKNSVSFEQGRLICIVGGRGEGKTTLLKLLGGVILPPVQEGMRLFIPSHLRVLNVSPEKHFLVDTLLKNLTLGVRDGDDDAATDRVLQICKDLGIATDVLNMIGSSDIQPWTEVLSHTECMLLCIARALIANPEVLILHRPTASFDRVHSESILGQLREFVDKKGILQDESMWYMRRPRTCIMSGARELSVALSDHIYLVSKDKGLKKLDRASVTPSMLG
eukprot:gnl/TRDRNA2_/TRDRNA2_4588_c1_seq1.p1 gnl/TRDRNA2_/TRDRNA2_4588_c1~~gnl/TRDRNA2_/TRDRNA2_4588_c1_seq1.p1  ORF type:complete len:255 (+),score=36.01 gnl/TRDRNA2_/TRDRNA2_4588_c1_seq1:61-765(+)